MAVDRRLARRAALVIAATVGLAVLLTMVLAYFKFERKLIEVATSRLAVVVEEVRRKTEFGLTLGLDLAELQDAQALLERAAATAPEVVGLEIAADDGAVLYATDPERVGRPGRALAAAGRTDTIDTGGSGRVVLVDGDDALLTTEIRNSFGQMVGSVALHASLAALRRDVAAVRGELARLGLALLAAAVLVTLAAVHLTLRHARTGGADGAPGPLHTGSRITGATAAAEDEMDAIERMLDAGDERPPAAGAGAVRA